MSTINLKKNVSKFRDHQIFKGYANPANAPLKSQDITFILAYKNKCHSRFQLMIHIKPSQTHRKWLGYTLNAVRLSTCSDLSWGVGKRRGMKVQTRVERALARRQRPLSTLQFLLSHIIKQGLEGLMQSSTKEIGFHMHAHISLHLMIIFCSNRFFPDLNLALHFEIPLHVLLNWQEFKISSSFPHLLWSLTWNTFKNESCCCCCFGGRVLPNRAEAGEVHDSKICSLVSIFTPPGEFHSHASKTVDSIK